MLLDVAVPTDEGAGGSLGGSGGGCMFGFPPFLLIENGSDVVAAANPIRASTLGVMPPVRAAASADVAGRGAASPKPRPAPPRGRRRWLESPRRPLPRAAWR